VAMVRRRPLRRVSRGELMGPLSGARDRLVTSNHVTRLHRAEAPDCHAAIACPPCLRRPTGRPRRRRRRRQEPAADGGHPPARTHPR
jgi:hypothetical protein